MHSARVECRKTYFEEEIRKGAEVQQDEGACPGYHKVSGRTITPVS